MNDRGKEYEYFGHTLKRYLGKAEEFVIPQEIRAIGDYAFKHCKSLKRIIVPDHVCRIGIYAFEWCDGLEEIRLPSRLEALGDGCFTGCFRLKSLDLPQGLTAIYIPLLKDCMGLQQIRVPVTVDKIVQNGFRDCHSLRQLRVKLQQIEEVPEKFRQIAALTYMEDHKSITDSQDPEVREAAGTGFPKGAAASQADGTVRLPKAEDQKVCGTDPLMEAYIAKQANVLAAMALTERRADALYYLIRRNLMDQEEADRLIEEANAQDLLAISAMLLDYRHSLGNDTIRSVIDDEFSLDDW